MKTFFKRLAFWLPLLILWAIPAALVAFAFQQAGGAEEEALTMPLPQTVDVGAREQNFAQTVSLKLTFEEEPPAVVGAGGTVTKIDYTPHEEIHAGDAIITLNGITLRAHRSQVPFHRDLARGDSGADVAELAKYLSKQLDEEVSVDQGDKFGYRLSEAVKKYQRQIGAPATGIFEKGYVIYLTDDITQFGPALVRLGDELSPGDEFATPAEAVVAARLDSQDGGPIKTAEVPGPYEMTLNELVIDVDELTFDEEKAREIYETIREAEIRLSETENPAERQFPSVRVAIQNSIEVATVAPGAIYASPSGQLCIFEAHQDGATLTGTAIPLNEAGGFSGEISLTALDIQHVDKTVIRAPQTLSPETLAECP